MYNRKSISFFNVVPHCLSHEHDERIQILNAESEKRNAKQNGALSTKRQAWGMMCLVKKVLVKQTYERMHSSEKVRQHQSWKLNEVRGVGDYRLKFNPPKCRKHITKGFSRHLENENLKNASTSAWYKNASLPWWFVCVLRISFAQQDNPNRLQQN